MREILPENAADYLRETGRVPQGRSVQARALGWGVSNVVIRVDVEGEPSLVLKQARERLRVKMLWVSRLERIWTEREAMGLLAGLLPEGAVPRVLFSDEPNYLYAMTLAPEGSAVWKEQLLAGQVDPVVATQAGVLLGKIHAGTIDHPALTGRLADTTVFDELRVDPFYRTVAQVHEDLASAIRALIEESAAPPVRSLVLGDFSPKNILVHPPGGEVGGGLTLVDFETAHAGDPSYDLGFFLSHIWLKGLRACGDGHPGHADDRFAPFAEVGAAFLNAYRENGGPAELPAWPPFEGTGDSTLASRHLAACVLARVDGKSPVDYLDEDARGVARELSRRALLG